MVEDLFAGEPRDERAAGEEKSGSALEGVGMGITEPEDLRSDVRGVEVQPGDAADLRPIQPIECADLRRGSPVKPDDRGKERLAVRVDRD
jgi:hypothetical protein